MTNVFKDRLPGELVKHVTAICGRPGEEWFEQLPRLIGELERKWSVTVHEAFPGIEFNFVAAATRGEEPVVVKLAPPYERTEIHAEAKYLRTRDGGGAVKLIAADRERHAIMIERAIPGEALFEVFKDDPAASVLPAIGVLRSVLRPPPQDMTDVDSLDRWFANFRRYRGTAFPEHYAEKAFGIYERLSTQPGRTFYLHGDFHPGNIVTSDRAPFLAIDPKGIVGHLGYDLAVFLNNLQWWRKADPGMPDLLNGAIGEFSAAFGMAERELREWAFAHMVIGAWWTFDEMPEHFDTDFAKIDIWDV
jgi:streptomycin 6-kinase